MKVKIQLPVNENPDLRSYAHHGYFHIIESSEDKVANENEVAALLSLNNYTQEDFHVRHDQLKYTVDSNKFTFYANKWNIDLDAVFYKALNQNNDEIEIRINKFLNTGPYASIKLFISPLSAEDLDNCPINTIDFGISLGVFAKDGIYSSTQQYVIEKLYKPEGGDIVLRLRLEDSCIYGSFKTDAKVSEEVLIKRISPEESIKTIGFAVCLGNNKYYENLFLNYINLEFYQYGVARLDFINSPIKNFNTFTSDYFIDSYIIYENEISKLNLSTLDYIKAQLSLGHYIITHINDNITCNKSDEKGCYFHENLIYGFDDEAQTLNIFYYDHGLIKKSSISYTDFNSERNCKPDKFLYIINYNPHSGPLIFSKEILARKFEKYLLPQNNEIEHSMYEFLGSEKGIKCLEALKSENYIKYLMKDIRISHVLYERAMINEKRIEYLFARKDIDENAYNKLKVMATDETKKTHILRNSILRMKMSKTFDVAKIQQYMNDLFMIDKAITLLMIDTLNNSKGEVNED